MLNFAKKLEFKTKNLKAHIVREQIRHIWVNKSIIELDKLFSNKLD